MKCECLWEFYSRPKRDCESGWEIGQKVLRVFTALNIFTQRILLPCLFYLIFGCFPLTCPWMISVRAWNRERTACVLIELDRITYRCQGDCIQHNSMGGCCVCIPRKQVQNIVHVIFLTARKGSSSLETAYWSCCQMCYLEEAGGELQTGVLHGMMWQSCPRCVRASSCSRTKEAAFNI